MSPGRIDVKWTRLKWALIKLLVRAARPSLPFLTQMHMYSWGSLAIPDHLEVLQPQLIYTHIGWIIYDSTHIKFSSTLSLPGCHFWRLHSYAMHGKAYSQTQHSTHLNRIFSNNLLLIQNVHVSNLSGLLFWHTRAVGTWGLVPQASVPRTLTYVML